MPPVPQRRLCLEDGLFRSQVQCRTSYDPFIMTIARQPHLALVSLRHLRPSGEDRRSSKSPSLSARDADTPSLTVYCSTTVSVPCGTPMKIDKMAVLTGTYLVPFTLRLRGCNCRLGPFCLLYMLVLLRLWLFIHSRLHLFLRRLSYKTPQS